MFVFIQLICPGSEAYFMLFPNHCDVFSSFTEDCNDLSEDSKFEIFERLFKRMEFLFVLAIENSVTSL